MGTATETHVDKKTGEAQRHEEDVNLDGLTDLVFHFRFNESGLPCDPDVVPFNGFTFDGHPITAGGSDAALGRDFAIGEDWTGTESLDFWYNGTGSGEDVTVTIKDNRAPDPGPSGWELVWSDEFDDAAGTPPDPGNWTNEIGDGALNGIEGWGNSELQYYTADPANAVTDGNGNLVVTLREADGSLECFYGTCEYTSARLISWHKAEFAYGRIESRLLVPTGGDGLWPAFWSLGTDIAYNPWPGAGEIDIMEYVSRVPNEIFGTIHGPGYNGGNAFGDIYDFSPNRVDKQYHTFAVEWQPDLIVWYVDEIEYHRATPGDVPGPWVFNKPFFLLLNFAIGGNFGGPPDPENTYPQEYLLDYVRVYQGPDTAERFETSFTDDFVGWQAVSIPLSDFGRSVDQPTGAPDDGLNLDEVWGYGFALPDGNASGELKVDLVRRIPFPPPTELVVANLDDSGPGSLREALGLIADGGTIMFDPTLADRTLTLTSGQLTVDRSVTVDASAAAPVTISAGGTSRVLQVQAGAVVTMNDLVIRDGVAGPQGGGILNFGELSLDRVVVTGNLENSTDTSFELGGGGIYNGDGATLNLTDSTVSNNMAMNQPAGGVYGFFNSTINVTNSTISGNLSGDVAGGLRTLGDANITGSTISGNTSTAWHGGGIFATDGTVTIENSSIVDNVAGPVGAGNAGGIMVATFGAPVLVTVENSQITGNVEKNCQIEGDPTVAVLTLLGGNTIDDGSCAQP
jgi:beta-glucanase (GH16 family)